MFLDLLLLRYYDGKTAIGKGNGETGEWARACKGNSLRNILSLKICMLINMPYSRFMWDSGF